VSLTDDGVVLPLTRSHHRSRLAVGALLLALLTAGCGSTVQQTGPTAAGGTTDSLTQPLPGDSLGEPGTEVVPVDPGAPVEGGTGTDVTGVPGDATGGPGDPAAPGTDPTAPGDPGPTPVGPGETGALKVSLLYLDGVNEMADALGLSGLATGDAKAQATAIVKYLNAKGGVAGRQIQLLFAPIDANEFADNRSAALEAACSQLTQDDKVAFVVSYLQLTEGFLSCLTKGGAALIDDASALPDGVMAAYGNTFSAPGDIATGRMLSELVESLWRTGWLTKDSKIGALSYDDAASVSLVNTALTQALARRGLKLTEYQRISNSADGVAQSSSAVLRYRTSGVDRIIPVNSNPLFVMQAASSQGYRPRYAFYSLFGPGALMESLAPRDQLTGAAGIGWSPYLDIGRGKKPGPVSGNETACFEVMKQAGQTSSSATTKALQLQLCNAFFYLAHAGAKVGSAPANLLGLARAKVGSSFAPADTFKTDVSKRPDGVAAIRALAFSNSCSCFQYGALRTTS
jgi:hypothetical protein